ncbi:MAG: thioredoxin family protein [Anaerolineales bacterium]|nr:thioredoxin family protein [Anaerolineales bacterium]
MEKLITEDVASQIAEIFEELVSEVRIIFFTKAQACEYCDEIDQLIGEVAELSDLISLEVFDIDENQELAGKYNVQHAPTLVMLAQDGEELTDYGVRLLGAPAGHEFTTLIHDILYISKRSTDLNGETREYLHNLTEPLLLQVFVTPTCPYCPQAVLLAHQMAMESELVQAEMVEATEFSDLAARHMVSGVPQTTVNNGLARVVGAVPAPALIEQIEKALAGK